MKKNIIEWYMQFMYRWITLFMVTCRYMKVWKLKEARYIFDSGCQGITEVEMKKILEIDTK